MAQHLVAAFRERAAASAGRPALFQRAGDRWQGTTYGELRDRVDALASWLLRTGFQRGDRAVIFALNSPMWTIADLAVMTAGGIPVPVYATNTAAQATHIVRDAGARVAFVGGADHYARLSSVRGAAGPLERIVVFDPAVAIQGADAYHLDSLPRASDQAALDARARQASVDEVATIIYTSGTTGDPKGVVLTYANLWSQVEGVDAYFSVSEDDRSLCFLPLSHAYERVWTFYIIVKGAQNYYLEDPKRAIETMKEVRPTCMVSVPRLYEKVYAAAMHKRGEASALRRSLFDWAIAVGRRVGEARARGEAVAPHLALQHAVADRLVLHKIREVVGGPKSVFSAGGAALSAEIEEFFFAAGLLVCQGYGLTETSPMLTCNRPGDFRFGTVGKPIPGCELKIAADGEILARGTNVMREYFGKPEQTREVFEDGWLKTGDIGAFDADGFLRITDRKKDLIITSGGENIAPSRIESVIGKDYYIDQVAAVGEGRHYVAALVVPQFEALEEWARERGLTYESLRALVLDARVVAFFAERIEKQQAVLAGHEK
ncbi:MAG TPA: long-chain fatty acid--CoA ligase, partial [Vicinamibacterales bacterium]|nr:long-chain fatty acid--CoA ligase [Vicinamibacterales bacterium]